MNELNKSGIYKITNSKNGKCYIGLAKNISQRWSQHRNFEVNDNSKKLYWAFQEYGIDNFDFEVIKYCEPNKLAYWERYYIEQFDSFKNGYNSSLGGEGGSILTLSDKFDIDYEINTHDSLTYHSDAEPNFQYKKYVGKKTKKQQKFEKKKNKKQIKNKSIFKFEIKWNKKLFKLQLKIDMYKKQVEEIRVLNEMIYKQKFLPVKSFLESEQWHDFSHEDLEKIYIQTIASKFFQRNNVKYKNYHWENTYANVKFSRNNILFKVEGLRDLKIDLESINFVTVTVTDKWITCYFNDSYKMMKYLTETTFLSSEKPDMPSSPLFLFDNITDFKGFISSIKRMLGK